jgi:hypothetical protein
MIKMKGYGTPAAGISPWNFPDDAVNPEEKQSKDWCVQFAKSIYSMYCLNLTAINFGDLPMLARLRSYGNGAQSTLQYMDILDPEEAVTTGEGLPSALGPGATTQMARKGFMNINWDILKIAPKFKNYLLGLAEEIDYDVFADGVDEKSSQAREMEKWKLWVEMQFGKQVAEMAAEAGVEMQQPDYVPETMQELEMFSQMGGFKLKSEIAIESALNYTLDLSKYKEVKRKCVEDLFELGMCGTKDYVDPSTNKVMVRYVNPARGVFPFKADSDYRNMPFAGEFVTYTIAELRAMNKPDGSGALFTDEELHSVAGQFIGLMGNPMTGFNANYQSQRVDSLQYFWNQFNVCVLDCEYKSDDYKYTTSTTLSDGTVETKASKFGKVRNSDTKKTNVTKTLMVYKCKWIIGTDLAWDYGHQFDIPRPTPSECNLSFHFSRIQGPSMVQMMIQPLDQIQLAWLRLQNCIATSAPNGLAVDVGSLSNVNVGGSQGKLSPLQLLKLRNQQGTLLYSATTHRSYMPTQNNYKPIQELTGGSGQQLQECIMMIDQGINLIQDMTGINRIASAQNPTGEDLVGVSQLAVQATQTTLKPLFSQYLSMKQRMCRNVALRVQLLVRARKYYDGYYLALGSPVTQALKIGSEINNAMFNIRIMVRPSMEEKAKIDQAATISMQAGRNGQPGITMSDYLTINRFIQQGMLKYAEAYLAYRENVAKKEAQQIAQQNSQQQQDAMIALEQQKEKSQTTLMQMEIQKEQAIIQAKTESELALQDKKHQDKMAELELTINGQVQQTQMNNQSKVLDTVISNKTKKDIANDSMINENNYLSLEHRKIDETPKKEVVKK